jgi:two-component system sensor histidine kinase KdpD
MAIHYFPEYIGKLRSNQMIKSFKQFRNWTGYLLSLAFVGLATLSGYFVREFFAPENIIMIYLLFVTLSAVFCGLGPSIMISILSVLAFDFFFIQPHFTFAVTDSQYIFTFIALLIIGITISYLTSLIRQQAETAKQRECETAALYALGRDLVISQNLESYISAIVKRIKETLGLDIAILLPDLENDNQLKIYSADVKIQLDKNEQNLANSFFQHILTPEKISNISSNTNVNYIPLTTARGIVGLMYLKAKESTEQIPLLEAYIDLAAVAIEGIQMADALRNAKVLQATEKLQTSLLNAISHDLRTPLVSVIGVLSSLQEEAMDLNDSDKRNLIEVAREEADRLNRLITNLLDESRIEAGAIKLSRQPSEVQDLIGAALEQLGSRSRNHTIKIDITDDMPFLYVDFGLIVQALVNIIDNAFKYSPPSSVIEIYVRHIADMVQIKISDRGSGILPQDLTHIFDKFYRIKRPDVVSGTGLGLSISKGIVEIHGGHITAENRDGGGTIISIILPLQKPNTNNKQ